MNIVITGGTSGIGRGVANYYSRRGDNVILLGNRDNGAEVAAELGSHTTFKKVDVIQEGQVKQFFAELGDTGIDVLVNSAGIYIGNDEEGISSVSASDFEQEWRVNTLGTFLTCKYALPLLKKNKGNIVNVVSISGMQPDVLSIGYTSSKAATAMLTKTLALAHIDDGVRINAVCPGPIDTPLLYRSFGGKLEGNPEYEDWISNNPMKRYGKVEDVVKGVAYLADPENTYVTGTMLMIDGGWMAKTI